MSAADDLKALGPAPVNNNDYWGLGVQTEEQKQYAARYAELAKRAEQEKSYTDSVQKDSKELQDRLNGLMGQMESVKTQIKMTPDGQRVFENSQLKYDKDGKPIAPMYETGRDANGKLLDALSLKKQGDVTADRSALDAMKARALSDGPSPWAKMMLQKQGMEQSQAGDQAAISNQAQNMAARSQMAQSGGLGSGSRERMNKASMMNGLLSQQNVGRQGMLDRANIGLQDDQTKTGLLSQVQTGENQQAGLMQQNRQYSTDVDKYNTQNTMTDLMAKRGFDANSYGEAMKAWAAEKTGQAQSNAGGGGGLCCFIFLEARYGNGTMDAVVRRFRDEHMTAVNRRGYYKLSEVLVPVMRKSKLVKAAVRVLMTDPLVAYGKYHYGTSKLGVVFKPVAQFWLKAFEYLGGDHQFIRENGEVV